MSLPFGPSNVTCLLAVSTATIFPWTVSTVSAAIPPSGAALGGAADSAGRLAGGELWVLLHPAITIASAANNDNWSIARFFMSSFPCARVFPGSLYLESLETRTASTACHPDEVERLRTASSIACHPDEASHASLLVILTKRATRADGRISDSFASAKPVPVSEIAQRSLLLILFGCSNPNRNR